MLPDWIELCASFNDQRVEYCKPSCEPAPALMAWWNTAVAHFARGSREAACQRLWTEISSSCGRCREETARGFEDGKDEQYDAVGLVSFA